jgi:hypothetical protein
MSPPPTPVSSMAKRYDLRAPEPGIDAPVIELVEIWRQISTGSISVKAARSALRQLDQR